MINPTPEQYTQLQQLDKLLISGGLESEHKFREFYEDETVAKLKGDSKPTFGPLQDLICEVQSLRADLNSTTLELQDANAKIMSMESATEKLDQEHTFSYEVQRVQQHFERGESWQRSNIISSMQCIY